MPLPDKYRPESIEDLILPPEIINQILSWMNSWKNHEETKKAIILYGNQGVGKTSLAVAIAKHFDLPLIEMNASDQRNRENMKKIALMASEYHDILQLNVKSPDRLILIDEADNILESRNPSKGGDAGGLAELLDIIKKARNPIIITMNDYYAFRRKNYAKEIISASIAIEIAPYKKRTEKNYRLFLDRLQERLANIAKLENINVNSKKLNDIIKKNEPDIRATLNDLELLKDGGLYSANVRDTHESIYYMVDRIFRSGNYDEILKSLTSMDEDPGFLMEWLDQNMYSEFNDPADLKNSYEILSIADIYFNRRLKDFSLSSYAGEISGGISLGANNHDVSHYVKYHFPEIIQKMSNRKSNSEKYNMKSFLDKISIITHTSNNENAGNLWFYKIIKKNDRLLMTELTKILSLTDREKSILD